MKFQSIIQSIEKHTGLGITKLRNMGIHEIRAHCEKKHQSPTRFVSEFPQIGRGNVLRDGLLDTETLNKQVDKILSGEK